MKRLIWVFLLGSAFGQGFFYSLPQPYPNTTIRVCPLGAVRPCPSPSSIFNDSALTSPVVNPSNIGPGGQFGFFAATGQYTIQMGAPTNQTFNISLGGGGAIVSPLTTKGDVFGHSTVDARIPVGADTFVLTADSAQALGVKWAAPSSGAAFSAITSGTNTTAAMICGSGCSVAATGTGTVAIADGSIGGQTPSFFFNSDAGNGLGLLKIGGANDLIAWEDSTGAGVPVWGFNGTTAPSLWVLGNSGGWLGFSTLTTTTGACSVCLIPTATGLASSTDGATASGTFTATQYLTASNCTAAGTAANPSVVACGAAPAGVVYCDVAASAGTCVINTTAAGTNSDITLTATSSANTRLGKTCNTAPSVVPAIPIASISNGVSFTINVETGITNGFCYFYNIVNK